MCPLLLALLSWPAWSATPVRLPSGEDPARWETALTEARQLIPDLEIGAIQGDRPGVEFLSTSPVWGVRVVTRDGECPVFPVLPPATDASRKEVLVLAAYVLETATCVVPTPTDVKWPWLRVAGAADLVVKGVGWNTNVGIELGRSVFSDLHGFVGLRSATDMLHVKTGNVGVRGVEGEVGLGWLPGRDGGARATVSGGVARRLYDDPDVNGAWMPWVETEMGARIPLPGEGVRVDVGLAWSTDLGPRPFCDDGTCVDLTALRLVLGLDVDLEARP